MRFLLIMTIAVVAVARSCHKEKSGIIPVCIQRKIDSIKTQPKWNPPAQVDAYEYNGKTVYLFSSNCCDQYNELYDVQCRYICAPTGGYTGKGDGNCADFTTTAKHIKTVWKDDR